MSTTAYLIIGWYDDNLQWTPSVFNGIQHILTPQSDIWKPDIALQNGFTKLKDLGDDFILSAVEYDGYVSWIPFEVFDTKCSIDIKYFPFDRQTCDIILGVWISTVDEIDVEVGSKGIQMDDYQTNGEWDVVNTSAVASLSKYDESMVTFSITMKRKPQYIMVSVLLPILMLSILSVCTFIIPIESGEKISYAMTLYLAFAVFLTIVSSSLPKSATMSLLSTYLVVLLSIGTTIIIITAIQLRLHFRDSAKEIPHFLKGLARFCKWVKCRRSTKKIQAWNGVKKIKIQTQVMSADQNLSPTPKHECTKDKITWSDVTSAIDFLCFLVFFIVIIISTISLFVKGYNESNGEE
ncbi:neuronal acetylcholine receptor subunit alpha-6-like [Pecten maximus]|uniref:neuronal acetylcholine receptor subunit alpha-6-like n=1 Tax=Pecten maximus TaxID=6579 RepID=UPI00145896CB|nr:neuronal acetylcholine receptor subunit alpha-6-like [Pecten maximus]